MATKGHVRRDQMGAGGGTGDACPVHSGPDDSYRVVGELAALLRIKL
jgi:hypothetical protein